MACYIIAGKADDPSFARAEYAAKQIEAAYPNVFFQYEMKHPDNWKEFLAKTLRQYDFDGYAEDFGGPLVWTHEGHIVGGGAEFVQKVCIEKFGLGDPPSASDPMFKQIAADNLELVGAQHRNEIVEKCASLSAAAEDAGLLQPCCYASRRRIVAAGTLLEVWAAAAFEEERQRVQEAFSAGQPARISPMLRVGDTSQDLSHTVLLHPRPLAPKQVAVAPRRHIKEVGEGDALELEVPPRHFGKEPEDDLTLHDFVAAMSVLTGVGGVATWTGLPGGSQCRDPLDTHMQVLPLPLHSGGEASPNSYPLELVFERAVSDGATSLKLFPFAHAFSGIVVPQGGVSGAPKPAPNKDKKSQEQELRVYELGHTAHAAYQAARAKLGKYDGCLLAFTDSWLILVPLSAPAVGSALHEAWLRMPPPPACALCGVVVCPAVQRGFPETVGLRPYGGARLVSTRAAEEGIPEGTPEFEAASREVRVAEHLLAAPVEIIGLWAKPAA